jgi:hypothetical protein
LSVQSIPAHSPGQGGTDRVAPTHHVRPFAAVPLDMLEDVRLNPADFMLVCVLLMHARAKSTCYPSVRTLAREMRQSERCVQYGLKRLADAGWVTSRPASSPINKTGRELVLTWRVQSGAPGGVQKPYTQGLPRVQGRAPEWRKTERKIEGSALARGEEKKIQASPATQSSPSSQSPEKPSTYAEMKDLYGDWLTRPEGHFLRKLAEKNLAAAVAEARGVGEMLLSARTPARPPSRTASAPFGAPAPACRPRA